MKATELRIGNYHLYHIVDKYDERGEWDEVSQIDAEDFRILGNFDCPEYKPIPLDEEWLQKLGYCRYDERVDYFYDGNFRTRIDLHKCEFKFYSFCEVSNEQWYLLTVQYVHQLQNIYFALTGEELIVSSNRDITNG